MQRVKRRITIAPQTERIIDMGTEVSASWSKAFTRSRYALSTPPFGPILKNIVKESIDFENFSLSIKFHIRPEHFIGDPCDPIPNIS